MTKRSDTPGEPESTAPAEDYRSVLDEIAAQRAIGQRLVQIRGERSQQEFASRLGMHSNTLARYERGERAPDTNFVLLLMALEEVNPAWLLIGEGRERARSLDAELLGLVIERIEVFVKKEGLDVPPRRKAKLAVLLYEHIVARGGKADDDPFRRFLEALL